MQKLLELKSLAISYPGGFKLADVNLSINNGDCIAITGASGSGKSSILKAINRLIDFDSGEIFFESKSIRDYSLIDLRRQISYMFQRGLLFPHLTIEQNLILAIDRSVILNAVKDLLADCELDPDIYAKRKPRELSGGELQRAALALALVHKPKLLMLDEPFTGLDAETKANLVEYLKRLQAKFSMAILLVSHDAADIKSLASRSIELGVTNLS